MSRLFKYYSLLSCISYFIAAVIFFYKYDSIEGGIWAILAGFVAGITFHLYKLNLNNDAHFTIQSLDYLTTFSYLTCLIGFGFGLLYLFVLLYWNIFTVQTASLNSRIFPCVFSFLTGKWGFHLYRISVKFINTIMDSAFIPIVREVV